MPILVNTPLFILYNILSIPFVLELRFQPRYIRLYLQSFYRLSQVLKSFVFSILYVVPISQNDGLLVFPLFPNSVAFLQLYIIQTFLIISKSTPLYKFLESLSPLNNYILIICLVRLPLDPSLSLYRTQLYKCLICLNYYLPLL